MRTSTLVVPALCLFFAATPSASAQEKRGAPASRPTPTTVTGVLKGAAYTHDGKTEWAAFVVGESATYGVNGGGDAYASLKKLVGKRVAVRGDVATEFTGPDGKTLKLSGTFAGIRYDGNVGIRTVEDVSLQPLTALVATVERREEKSAADPQKPIKTYRLVVDGERPSIYEASPAAAKRLQDHVGKRMTVRCYLNGATVDAVESVSPAPPPASRPTK